MRVLIFGDSITQGMWDSKGGWAQRLVADSFAEQMKDLDAHLPYVFNLGFSGDTTKHLCARLPAETEARFSLWSNDKAITYVVAIGINDTQVIDGKPFSSPEQFAQELAELHQAMRRYSDKILFVGLTPVEDERPFVKGIYTTDHIWQFEQVLREFVEREEVMFVPLFETFKEQIGAGKNLLTDGLHPNDAGHELIHSLIKPRLQDLLGAGK